MKPTEAGADMGPGYALFVAVTMPEAERML